ncbi:hypothetical protein [uncultured Microbacterium sp.]|uniref:hypothetical protein n=1 Tax=uncultured Microbacterium sp. TaxID=191216 RepID=UPI0028D37719|nr:hypothetical protein [uncultured Microbacterium sp.]
MSLTKALPPTLPVALATAAILGSAALTAAPALAATTSSALVLQDATGMTVTSGDAMANPSFSSAYLAGGCPGGAQDAARLSVSADTSVVVVSPTVSTDGAAPVTVPMYLPFSEVVPAGGETGSATLTLECLAVADGIPVVVIPAATLPIAFSAGQWSVSTTPVPTPTPADASPAPTPSATGTTPTASPTTAASIPNPSASAAGGTSAAGRPLSGLANTGVQVASVVGIGVLALVAGLWIAVVRRRRQSAPQD